MKKLIVILGLLMLGLSFGAISAQSTSTSMTVVDPSSQTWANGFITYTFSQAPGFKGPYQWQGANLPSQYLTPQTATLNGSGSVTISLPDNTTITPTGSAYIFVVCSNTSFQCATVRVGVNGTTDDISAAINGALVTVNLPATTFPRAYTNNEITLNPMLGGLFYDTTSSCLKVWNGTTWSCLSTSTPTVFQTNSTNNISQDTLNLISTSSVTVTNTTDGTDSFAINPSLLSTLCLTSGTNCGSVTVNGTTCAIAGSCTLPAASGTTTVNTIPCSLGGSCTIPITGTTTVNTVACALGSSCTIPFNANFSVTSMGSNVIGTAYQNTGLTAMWEAVSLVQNTTYGSDVMIDCYIGTTSGAVTTYVASAGIFNAGGKTTLYCPVPAGYWYEIENDTTHLTNPQTPVLNGWLQFTFN